jgi:hypothetical protein
VRGQNELFDLGSVERAIGRLDDADVRHRETLTRFRLLGDSFGTIGSLAALARSARDRGHVHRAGRLWGAVEAAETSLAGGWAVDRPGWEDAVVARGVRDFEQAREEGRALSLDEAAAYALRSNE